MPIARVAVAVVVVVAAAVAVVVVVGGYETYGFGGV